MPARLPLFLHNLKNNLFPKYFIYSLVAAGGEILEKGISYKQTYIDKAFAKAAINSFEAEKSKSDPHIIWATSLMIAFHWKLCNIREMEYLSRKLFF
ncbi:hypothetical protein AYI70_g494 [Smittium culicis]|uniref:Uncharacterized protein n=1 Tax=Smittium culicis TaxID=133412 RepID=A0A1R1YGK1_9FUNG|nr:hypothetical protein AYI70_g494 [Smittium culicis]